MGKKKDFNVLKGYRGNQGKQRKGFEGLRGLYFFTF